MRLLALIAVLGLSCVGKGTRDMECLSEAQLQEIYARQLELAELVKLDGGWL